MSSPAAKMGDGRRRLWRVKRSGVIPEHRPRRESRRQIVVGALDVNLPLDSGEQIGV
jgi:hypothetical protein